MDSLKCQTATATPAEPGDLHNVLGDEGRSREARARAHREAQGERAGESRASVPGHQATVRFDEGAIPWTGEKHRPCDHVVRVVESVDGTTAIIGDDGIVASAAAETAKSEANNRSLARKPRFKNRSRQRRRISDPEPRHRAT